MDMKLRQKLTRMQANELQPEQEDILYKPKLLTQSNACRKASSLLMQFADHIWLHQNRILKDNFHSYKPGTGIIGPRCQSSLNCLSINSQAI